ncbi:MAG: 6-hydroxynicotinate reductase, partial [Paracoccaceae bacterium]
TYVWPGGGITVMVDVMDMPTQSFGYVPTPALVAPIEFTLRVSDYKALGGHVDHIVSIEEIKQDTARKVQKNPRVRDPLEISNYRWSKEAG